LAPVLVSVAASIMLRDEYPNVNAPSPAAALAS
jgi:hypothetical protein